MAALEHIGVVYVATDPTGEVLYVGKSSLAEWRGWEACLGACERRRRALHRPCAHIAGRGSAWQWRRVIDWAAGERRSRRPKPGRLTVRWVLDWRPAKHDRSRTSKVERATIARLAPRYNVAHNSARRLRSVV